MKKLGYSDVLGKDNQSFASFLRSVAREWEQAPKTEKAVREFLNKYLPGIRKQAEAIDSDDSIDLEFYKYRRQIGPYLNALTNFQAAQTNTEYEVIDVLADLLKDGLYDKYGRGIERAQKIMRSLRRAKVDPKFFILMKEPGMALHYAKFIKFYKKLNAETDLEKVSPVALRQKFIEALGTVTIYRASLYDKNKLEESLRSGGLKSNFLDKEGTKEQIAEIIRKYGILFNARSTIAVTDLPDEETGYDGREKRLMLSVSVVDNTKKNKARAEKRAQAVARQIANNYARSNILIDYEDDLDEDLPGKELEQRIKDIYGKYRIMVTRAEVPRFYLIQQKNNAGEILGDLEYFDEHRRYELDQGPKILQLQVEQETSFETINQLEDPYFEALIDEIRTEWISDVKVYPLGQGLGYALKDRESLGDTHYTSLVERMTTGLTHKGKVVQGMERTVPGKIVWQAQKRQKKVVPDAAHKPHYLSLGPQYGVDALQIAHSFAQKEKPIIYGDPRDMSNGEREEGLAESRKILLQQLVENGVPSHVADMVSKMLKVDWAGYEWVYQLAPKAQKQYDAYLVRVTAKMQAGIAENEENVGGIDLNPNTIDLDVQGQGNDFSFDLFVDSEQLGDMKIDGFVPEILYVHPLIVQGLR